MLRYCANVKAIRYESTSLNKIVADKLLRVIIALFCMAREVLIAVLVLKILINTTFMNILK